ncbi:hypothetical protein [Sphingomonas desiccabilis]|uniref:Uncharacterized protein n=1 Tax=Sphingomonas desiccabilis TaxID=429134 RepID=A0A4Q2ILU6_9SPHN|nr:hypothetical protein [Sphingomonas desiccabilis]MBB3912091.1 hypothetical protein [Sphingomonas desiccabilis]RXZ30260.1 hypothetical protein EO081_13705 [Sphingomonas desiccabilis]
MWRLVIGLLAVLLSPMPARADSWAPATRQTYESAGKKVRFTVIPRDLESSLSYFEDKVAHRDPAGQRAGGEPRARGILERLVAGRWTTVWEAPLVNEVAPVSALVTEDAAYVVTFDNWHSVGFGEHVVVLYRGDGSVVRSYELTDILPADYVRALPRSVSSLWWSGRHVLSEDGKRLVLKVVVPRASGREPRGYVDVTIDLATGAVAPLTGPDWDAAQAAAAPIAARDKAEEARWRASAIAPLSAPAGTEQGAWSRYLAQAMRRLVPEAAPFSYDLSLVLPAPSAANHARTARSIRGHLTKAEGKRDLAVAAPADPGALLRLLVEAGQASGPGSLAGSRLFVALPAAMAEPARAALAPTGATVILFDPAVAIPQRPEMLSRLGVRPDQVETEALNAQADALHHEANAAALAAQAPADPPVEPPAGEEGLVEMADDLERTADMLEQEAERLTADPAASD